MESDVGNSERAARVGIVGTAFACSPSFLLSGKFDHRVCDGCTACASGFPTADPEPENST